LPAAQTLYKEGMDMVIRELEEEERENELK
jgi:hypothetical protein